jgi:hypothetical protein
MPVPKYVPKGKRAQWEREHKKIVKALKKDDVKSPYAVATAALKKKYKK